MHCKENNWIHHQCVKVRKVIFKKKEKKGKNNVSVFHNLCNHIIVNRVIWPLTERQIYCVCERRLKYIELLKGLPAVHHCHLTHVECEAPSQQPLGGHLLPALTNRATYTHRVTPQISTFKDEKSVYCRWKQSQWHTRCHVYARTRCRQSLPNPPETALLRLGLVPACQKWTRVSLLLFFSFFFFPNYNFFCVCVSLQLRGVTHHHHHLNPHGSNCRPDHANQESRKLFFDRDGLECLMHGNHSARSQTVVVMFMHFLN